jgi:hypothetical protein
MPKSSPKKPALLQDEFAPDAWERFERLVKSAAKVGHMPHGKPPKKKTVKTRKK